MAASGSIFCPNCQQSGRFLPSGTAGVSVCSACGHRMAVRQWEQPSRGSAESCKLCAAPLNPLEAAQGNVCSRAECQQRHLGDQAAARRQANEAFQRQMEARAREFQGQQHDLLETESLTLAIVPVNTRSITHLPEQRKQAFLDHLKSVISEEESLCEVPLEQLSTPFSVPPAVEPPPTAAQDQLLGLSCAVCRGYCCRQGGEHAFQDLPSMRRIRATLSATSTDDLMALYAEHFPQESYQESCVFHTEHGCNLPREMRSDMCNRWMCAGQHRWLAELPPEGSLLGYVVATPDYEPQAIRAALVGASLVDENNIGLRTDPLVGNSSPHSVEKHSVEE